MTRLEKHTMKSDRGENALWHVVFISFREGTPQRMREKAYNLYQRLAEECGGREAGILFWKVDRNLDTRKNVHLVEIAIFKDNDALQHFRAHPKHKELTDFVREIVDWKVGDIFAPMSLE